MAKRIQFRAHGGPEVLEYVDYQPAEPGPQQVRVRDIGLAGMGFRGAAAYNNFTKPDELRIQRVRTAR